MAHPWLGRQAIGGWRQSRSLNYSLRRQLVDSFLLRWFAGLAPGRLVLNIGGSRTRRRGRFCLDQQAQRVLHLDLVAAHRPDVCADACHLPFADASFDVVVCVEAFEHILDVDLALREAARVLAGGGLLLATTPLFYRVHPDPRDYARYTEHFWHEMLERIGLEELELDIQGRYWSVLLDQVRSGLAASAWARVRLLRAAAGRLLLVLRWAALALDSRAALTAHPVYGGYTTGYGLAARKPGPVSPASTTT